MNLASEKVMNNDDLRRIIWFRVQKLCLQALVTAWVAEFKNVKVVSDRMFG